MADAFKDFVTGLWNLTPIPYWWDSGWSKGWGEYKGMWKDTFQNFYDDPWGSVKEFGKDFIAYDDWAEGRYGEATGKLAFNTATLLVGGGATVGFKNIKSLIKSTKTTGAEGVVAGAKVLAIVKLRDLPKHVQERFLRYQKHGWKGTLPGSTPGTHAGRIYENKEEYLPKQVKDKKESPYREFDVDDFVPGQSERGRNSHRFVLDIEDNIVYYADGHYENGFVEIDFKE